MPYQLIFREEVREETRSAYNWYETQRKGLGNEFLNELHNTLDLLRSNPQFFSFIYKTRRKIVLKRFPYKVIYEIFDNEVVVFSIRHNKQQPNF